MKLLVDMDWAELAEDMTDAELGEIFRCILEYPARDVKSPLWKFIKKQLARDKIKYDEKVARLAKNTGRENGANSSANHSETALKSDVKSDTKSPRNPTDSAPTSLAIKSIESNNQTKNIETANNALAVNRLIGGLARNFSPDKPKLYEITDDFDFYKIPDFTELLNKFDDAKVAKARASLWNKKYGEKLSLEYITKWIENEREFDAQKK